jgi:serine/threonine protein kinase
MQNDQPFAAVTMRGPMSLTSKLGPYEIQSPLGAGGMGEVYSAKDTRLGRSVALKILPESFAREADRLRRFEQEAQAVAALRFPAPMFLLTISPAKAFW